MIELYHWEPSVHFLKPLIALAEKQADFVSHWFDPRQLEQLAPDFPHSTESDLNLEGEGPVLVHDGAIIAGSFFMLEHIAEALPGPALLPADSYQRYLARARSQVLGASLGPTLSILSCARHLAPLLREPAASPLQAQIARIEPIERRARWQAVVDTNYSDSDLESLQGRLAPPVSRVEAALQQSAWLAGAEYSIADIDAFAMLDPLTELAPEMVNARATPRVSEFLSRMHARAAVRAALARSRSGSPRTAFVPGMEASRWG
jgi:glutathione S-transferase